MRDASTHLSTLKASALMVAVLASAGIGLLMFLARGTGEDITGIVFPALVIAAISSIVATLAHFAGR